MPTTICSHDGCTSEASYRNPRTGEVFCEEHVFSQIDIATGNMIDEEHSTYVEDVVVFNGHLLSGRVEDLSSLGICQCGRRAIKHAMVDGTCSICEMTAKRCPRCGSKHNEEGEYCGICKNEVDMKYSPEKIDKGFVSNKVLDYNFTPTEWPVWGGKSSRLYGIEIELTSLVENPVNLIRKTIGSFALLEHDGSIHSVGSKDQYGNVEIVTPPATKSVIDHFMKKLDGVSDKFYHEKNKSCGIHIHVSRSAFKNQYHVAKFLVFFAKFPEFIHKIGERKAGSYNKDESTGNIIGKAKNGGGEKYDAVNLRHKESVEIRIFKSSMHHHKIMKNIEFIDTLINYTRDSHVEKLSVDGYVDFVKSTTGANYLINFLTKNEIIK